MYETIGFGNNSIERKRFARTGASTMGKRRRYRFPKGINDVDRFYYPHPAAPRDNFPTNLVTDLFGLNNMVPEMNSDVLGSYTGVPRDRSFRPIQDADDL